VPLVFSREGGESRTLELWGGGLSASLSLCLHALRVAR